MAACYTQGIADNQAVNVGRDLEFLRHVANECGLLSGHLDADNASGSATDELKAYGSGTGKEVEHGETVEVHAVL